MGKFTLRIAKTYRQGLRLWFSLAHICSCIPHPRPVTANIGAQLHVRYNVVIRADFQGLVPSHDQSRFAVVLVLEQPHIARAAFLPLPALTVEFEEFGAHFERLLLGLLVRLGIDLLGQVDNRFKMYLCFLLVLFDKSLND